MSNLFLYSSPTSLLLHLDSVSVSIILLCFHQPLKVRIMRTYTSTDFFSHIFSSHSHSRLPLLEGHTAHLHLSAVLWSKQHLTQAHE